MNLLYCRGLNLSVVFQGCESVAFQGCGSVVLQGCESVCCISVV